MFNDFPFLSNEQYQLINNKYEDKLKNIDTSNLISKIDFIINSLNQISLSTNFLLKEELVKESMEFSDMKTSLSLLYPQQVSKPLQYTQNLFLCLKSISDFAMLLQSVSTKTLSKYYNTILNKLILRTENTLSSIMEILARIDIKIYKHM